MSKQIGSTWHKWDLHYHSPKSYDYHNKSKTVAQLVNELVDANVSGVVVTDHHVIDFDFITALQAEADRRIKFLRGIEVTSQLGGSQTVHFTCIFPENISNEDIENEFLVQLGIPSNKKLTDAEHQAISLPHLDIIKYARKLGCLIGVHAKGKSNSIENIDNSTSAKMVLKAKILGDIHFLETGKIVDSCIYHDVIFKDIGFERPIVVCSDYHAEYNYGQYKNNGTGQIVFRDTTWIKSELSFAGLRQMCFEPDLRVRVQSANPYEDKHGIQLESVSVEGSRVVNSEMIPLNRDMIAVIGEKGSGKTALLDFASFVLGTEIGKESFISRAEMELTCARIVYKNYRSSQTSVDLTAKSSIPIQCTYINPFMLVKLLGVDNSKLQEYIRGIIYNDSIVESEENINDKSRDCKSLLEQIVECEKIIILDHGAISRLRATSESLDDLQKTQPKSTEADEKLNDEYAEAIAQMDKVKNLFDEFNAAHIATVCFLNELDETLSAYRNLIIEQLEKDLDKTGFPSIDFNLSVDIDKPTREKLEQYSVVINKKKEDARKDLEAIAKRVEELKSKLFKNQEERKRYDEWKARYDTLVTERGKIGSEISLINNAKEQKKDLFERLYQTYFELIDFKKKLLKLYNDLKSQIMESINEDSSTLEFEPTVSINYELFESLGSAYLDGRSAKDEIGDKMKLRLEKLKAMIESSNDLNKDEIISILTEMACMDVKKIMYGGVTPKFRKGWDASRLLEMATQDYFSINYEIKFNGMPVEQLSAGQKGTVLMKILLRMDRQTGPLLIDQPEDNLDNKSIFDELVKEFKLIKQKRQLIIATHNPNLVVNTDAEQIIVASYDRSREDGFIAYKSGALENAEIRDEVCRILEGGVDAFLRREQKYGFK